MATSREIRAFDYVNFPYERVRTVLTTDALAVFDAATRAAAGRTHAVASLHVELAGIEFGKKIQISVRQKEQKSKGDAITRLEVDWKAVSSPGLFPLMKAELALYPLTATESQLDFSGRYEPPLGWLGVAIDAVVGRRIAEASVHRFVAEVAHYLRTELRNESRT